MQHFAILQHFQEHLFYKASSVAAFVVYVFSSFFRALILKMTEVFCLKILAISAAMAR